MAVTISVMPTPTGLKRYYIADTAAELPTSAPAADGDIGYAKDTDLIYSYNGSAWTATLASGSAAGGVLSGTYPSPILGSIPCGSFSDSTTQTFATAGTVYPITFDTDEKKNQITHSTSTNPSRITITVAGTYLIAFSACVSSPSVNKHINIFLKVDGSIVARTGTELELPISGESVMTVTLLYTFTAGQYFELCAVSDVNNMTIVATAAGASYPASPSIIVTVNQIST